MNRGVKTRRDAAFDARLQLCTDQLESALSDKLTRSAELLRALTTQKNPDEIARLLDEGSDLAATDAIGNAALHYAVQSDHSLEIVALLLGAGADANLANRDTDTPLAFAIAQNSDPAVLDALIAGGARTVLPPDPNIGRRSSFVAATDALRAGYDIDVVERLLAAGPTLTDVQIDSLLFAAALSGDPDSFVALYDAQDAPFRTDEDVAHILFRLVRAGDATLRVTERLLTHVDVAGLNRLRNNAENILEVAFERNAEPEVILALIANGALIGPDVEPEASLYFAIAEQRDAWLLQRLLSGDLNPNHVFEQKFRWTYGPVTRIFSHFPILHVALVQSRGNTEKVQALLDAGADPNTDCTSKCSTIEAFLAGQADRRSLTALLNAGLDVNAVNQRDNNFLHLAVLYHNYLIIPDLVKFSVDLEQRNIANQTPLWVALDVLAKSETVGDIQMGLLQTLIDVGADLSASGPYGETAMAAALRMPNGAKVVQFLLEQGWDPNGAGTDGLPLLWEVLDITPFNRLNFDQLVVAGADNTTRNTQGQTKLEAALARNDASLIVPTLIANGGDVLAPSSRGIPLLTEIVSGAVPVQDNVLFRILDTLVSRPDFRDFPGRDALIPLAIENEGIGRPALAIMKLAQSGADINARDSAGDTPLHVAVAQTTLSETVIKALISNGADVMLRNARDELPFQIVKQRQAVNAAPVQTLLVEAGGGTHFIKEWQHRGILFYVALAMLAGLVAVVEVWHIIRRWRAGNGARTSVPSVDRR